MKRIFVLFSIILLLGSNIAMALDTDCLPNAQQQSTFDIDQNQDNDPADSDNCCHSASHFVGIYPDIPNNMSITGSQFVQLPFDLMSSQTYQPAIPPPTV